VAWCWGELQVGPLVPVVAHDVLSAREQVWQCGARGRFAVENHGGTLMADGFGRRDGSLDKDYFYVATLDGYTSANEDAANGEHLNDTFQSFRQAKLFPRPGPCMARCNYNTVGPKESESV